MAHNEDVATGVRHALAELDVHPVERRMFGGVAFMVAGHMAVAVFGDELVVRVGKDGHEQAVAEPHARAMDLTGRPMTGMVCVTEPGMRGDDLLSWVRRGLDHTSTLAPK